jgi:DNA-directed RNA polymerase specialized sigma24 family protein
MKKKSEAQIFLERVEMLDRIIENKLIEQRQWRELALNITANVGGDRVQSSGTQSKMADAVIKCVDIEAEINNLIDELVNAKKNVIAVIEKLNSPTEYRILHMRYIQHIRLDDIADIMKREYTTITTTHGRALKNVQKILDRRDS